MALADFATYKAALNAPAGDRCEIAFISNAVVAARPYDLWRAYVPVGAVPTTAEAPTSATLGAFGQTNGGSGALVILASRFNGMNPGQFIVCDRLSHQGGLSGTVVGEQTTNLPTAALTRYTSGVGVQIGLTIYTAVGTTATTVTVSYTNTADSAGQVSPAVQIGATGFNAANRMISIPLAAGDTGVKSVESVTLAASTVSAAGNFGVTLYKPIYVIGLESTSGVSNTGFVTGGNFGLMPEIVDDSCLFCIAISGAANAQADGALLLTEC